MDDQACVAAAIAGGAFVCVAILTPRERSSS